MIPKLYNSTRIQPLQEELVATLAEAISCTITEELNGTYELVLTYPTNGKRFDDLMNGGLLLAQHPYRYQNSSYLNKANEPFDIYKQEVDNDILTVYAHHASYRLGGQILTDINVAVGSPVSTLASKLSLDVYPAGTLSTAFSSDAIKSYREYYLDSEYSLASVYGWEFYFDGHTANYIRVNAYTHRGNDFGVQLRFGKNITSAFADRDKSESYNALVPYWESNGQRALAITSQNPVSHTVQPTNPPAEPVKAIPMDFTEKFSTAPTSAQLITAARNYLDANEPWHPTEEAEIGFYPIWEASTFTNTAYIEGVCLGDDVTVFWNEGGLNGTKLRAVKTTYDVLLERFTEIQLGALEKGFVVTSDGKINAVQSSGGGGGVPAIYLTSVPCSAMTGNFVNYNDAAITADYVVAECVFASPLAITTDVSWTTSAGNIKLNGTCSSATTCNLVLVSQ